MTKIVGYDGGDGEEQLLEALKQELFTAANDSWERIRTKNMWVGSIIEIAQARGYIKASRLGFAGYVVTKVGYAETYCRQCWQCWQKRRDFDAVREWVQQNNNFKPGKLSGPLLFLDSHKAWSDRLKPDGATMQPPKKLNAKELRQLLQAYRNMLDRIGGEHLKLAADADREPRVWHQVVQERAALEAELNETSGDPSAFPVTAAATRDGDGDTDPGEQDPAKDDEPHLGTVPVSEHSSGPGFIITEPIVPLKRTPRPTKPVLALANEPVAEQAGNDLLGDLAAMKRLPVEKPDDDPAPKIATPIKLDPELNRDPIATVEKQWKLKGWSGKPATDEDAVRSKRASFFQHHPNTSAEDATWLAKQKRDFWRVDDDTAVIERLQSKGE